MNQEVPDLSPAELNRRLKNIVRRGVVAEVRAADPAMCRVQCGELLTDWLPWVEQAAAGLGKVRHWRCPVVNERAVVLSPGGDMTQGMVYPGLFSDETPQPSQRADVERHEWTATDSWEHDHSAGTLTISIGASVLVMAANGCTLTTQQLTVDSPQSTFTGKVTVQGLFSYQAGISGKAGGAGNSISGGFAVDGGSITHNGANVGSSHKHTGVHGETGGPH